MEQILPYLPTNEAHALQAHQKTYDPQQAAKNRAWHKQQGPSVSEESLTFITNPPYVNALARHKSIAEKILEVLKVKIDGAKATIEVSTTSGAIVDGKEYPYGTASIELEGEGNTWKIGAYNDGNFAYLEPPPPKL